MKIQFNTGKTINGDERLQDFFSDLIAEELDRYQSDITKIEVSITDQNGKNEGLGDIKCMLEARLEGMQPIAVSDQSDTIEGAVSGAVDNLKASLDAILGRLVNH